MCVILRLFISRVKSAKCSDIVSGSYWLRSVQVAMKTEAVQSLGGQLSESRELLRGSCADVSRLEERSHNLTQERSNLQAQYKQSEHSVSII